MPGLRNLFRLVLLPWVWGICWLIALPREAIAQIPAIRQINLRQGLPQSEILCMLEDNRGYLWAGTRGGGLVQLNGASLNVYTTKDGLSSDFISDIQKTPDGSLLITGLYGGIQKFNGISFGKILKSRRVGDYLRTLALNDSTFYSIHPKGVSEFRSKSGFRQDVYRFAGDFSGPGFSLINGKRWLLICADSGLFSIDLKSPDRSFFLRNDTHLKGHAVSVLHSINENNVALIAGNGYSAVLDYSSGWPIIGNWTKLNGFNLHEGERLEYAVFGIGQAIECLLTSENRLICSGKNEMDLIRLHGMKTASFSGIISDKNKTLWIGTSGSGILSIPPRSAFSFSEIHPLANGRLNAVLKTRNGKILAGGKSSGLIIYDPGTGVVDEKWRGTDIYALAETDDYYLCGTQEGISLLNKTDFSELKTLRKPGRSVCLRPLPDGSVLIGTFGSGAWIWKKGSEPVPLFRNQTEPEFPYDFLSFKKNSYLIVSNSGLWKTDLSGRNPIKINPPDSISSSFFLGAKDNAGNYWFSNSAGLVRWTGSSWLELNTKNGLSSTLIYTLNADSRGNIWAGTGKGLDEIVVNETGKITKVKNYGPEDGFDGYEANMRGSYMIGDELFICTVQGLFSLNTRDFSVKQEPSRPQISLLVQERNKISDTLFDGRLLYSLPARPAIYLNQLPELLLAEFQTINPLQPAALKYSWRLKGRDSSWSPVNSTNRAAIRLTESGEYLFEVRSTLDGINFSEPDSIRFVVSVPWYLSQWIFIPLLLLLILLILIFRFFPKREKRDYTAYLKNFYWSENSGLQITLILTVFYPAIPFLAAQFDPGICIHPVQQAGIAFIFTAIFIYSVTAKRDNPGQETVLRIIFFLMAADSSWGLVHNQLSPFYAGLLFAVSAFSIPVLNQRISVILFGIYLNVFSFWAAEYIEKPVFPALSFQLVSASLSVFLILIALARHSSEEKWLFASKVVNDGPDLVLAFSQAGELLFVSRNSQVLAGYPPELITGEFWWHQVIEAENDRQEMKKALVSGEQQRVLIHLRRRDHQIRSFRFTSSVLNSRIVIFLGEDVTEKEYLESRFENLIVHATDSIFQTDTTGRIIYANPQSGFLLGVMNENLIGRFYTEFVVETHRNTVRQYFQEQLKAGHTGSALEFPVLTKGGFSRWMAFQTSLLYRQGSREVDGILAIGRDITERKESEELIRTQHRNISDSLAYANRIRSALQPANHALAHIFSDFALLDKPKDIIGGDFVWSGWNGNSPLLVLGDCTGHGVPGAFMTTIAMGLLREIVNENRYLQPESILGKFNKALNASFGRAARPGEEEFDFAELALISLDKENAELVFISSGIGLHRVRNGELTSFPEASKGLNFKLEYAGMEQRIPLQPEDVFYLFSDGLFDQIGGPDQKRLSKARLKQVVLGSDRRLLPNGMQQIRHSLENWQGRYPQTDDQMMISFRV